MKTLRSKLSGLVLCAVIMSLLVTCGRRSSHCYLCQGIPYEAPCLVDLSTGDVAPLTVSNNNGAASIWFLGKARVVLESEAAHVTIPSAPQTVSADLFCEDCMALVDATPNSGYVLADLSDLGSIQLYPIVNRGIFTIRSYNISIVGDRNLIGIWVTAS